MRRSEYSLLKRSPDATITATGRQPVRLQRIIRNVSMVGMSFTAPLVIRNMPAPRNSA